MSKKNQALRFKKEIEILKEQRPDVFCLQEVTTKFLELLLAESWMREQYCVSDKPGFGYGRYGLLICTRLKFLSLTRCTLPSQQSRYVLVAKLRCGEDNLWVSTSHLESKPQNTIVRIEQMKLIFNEFITDCDQVLFMGDFNCDDQKANTENRNIPDAFTDCWCAVHAPTEDKQLNRGTKGGTGTSARQAQRLDRILIKSTTWRPTKFGFLGDEAFHYVSDGGGGQKPVYPSDHKGIVTIVERTNLKPRKGKNTS